MQSYFPECWVLIEDLEAHVQEAENQMFPARMAEEDVWVQQILEELITPGKVSFLCTEASEEASEKVAIQVFIVWLHNFNNNAIILCHSSRTFILAHCIHSI